MSLFGNKPDLFFAMQELGSWVAGWLGGWVAEVLGSWVDGWLGSWGAGWLGWLGGWVAGVLDPVEIEVRQRYTSSLPPIGLLLGDATSFDGDIFNI